MAARVPQGRLFLNTYKPLVRTEAGIAACARHGLPPFVDGSIRREPGLEHVRPSISCLCRGANFAPRLRVGDRVVYMTVKDRYGDEPGRHRRLAAVLRVIKLFDSHAEAAAWYRRHGWDVPSNCIVPGNGPLPLGKSSKCGRSSCGSTGCGPSPVLCRWDAKYRSRAKRYGRFVACRPVFVELSWSAPVVHDRDLVRVFGCVPGTRNPGELPLKKLKPLLRRVGLRVPTLA